MDGIQLPSWDLPMSLSRGVSASLFCVNSQILNLMSFWCNIFFGSIFARVCERENVLRSQMHGNVSILLENVMIVASVLVLGWNKFSFRTSKALLHYLLISSVVFKASKPF